MGLALGELTDSVVPVLGALAGVRPLYRWRRRRNTVAQARRRAAAVIELCVGLSAELRSGATAEQALNVVISRSGPHLWQTLGAEPTARLTAARYGADVPAALRLAAELPGGRGAAAVAACWQVTTASGTSLAAGLDQVADALRAERALAEEIAGELAGPRTTAVMLAALPLVGTLLGLALGAQPVRILLHTPAGLGCLLGGVLLEAAGLWWTSRIVRAAEDLPDLPEVPEVRGRRAGEKQRHQALACGLSRTRAAALGVGT
ncbi:type II secretion system F family protein [Kitasatospora sp. NBC_00374]|uniref:type II secretion system F family protein n=1 Tax=Kitasatospora sp. NBC_00374 TaxID=2975964 RepID=UPI0032472B6C